MPRRDHSAPNTEDGVTRANAYPSDGLELRLPIAQIDSSPLNPRKRFAEEQLRELAASLELDGLLQPILVKRTLETGGGVLGGDRYEIVAGERRWRAAKLLGWTEIRAIARRDIDEATHVRLALLENLARTDLDPLEEAAGYQQLQELGMTQQAIADAVHRSQPSIANAIRLLSAPEEVRAHLEKGNITPSHVLALLRFAAFPQVLVKIAELAAEKHTPTKVLEKGLGELGYEFTSALTSDKLVVDVYRAEFDHKICEKCPFGAYVGSRYGGYCMKPEHFKQLQKEARTKKKEQLQKAIDNAAKGGKTALKLNQLKYGQYEQLYQVPQGCTKECECRATALDHGNRPVEICMKPSRLHDLNRAQREREAREQKQHIQQLRQACETALTAAQAASGTRELAVMVGALARESRGDSSHFKAALKAHAPTLASKRDVTLDDLAGLELSQLLLLGAALTLSQELFRMSSWREAPTLAPWYAGQQKPKRTRSKKATAAPEPADDQVADELVDGVIDEQTERELAELVGAIP